MFVILPKLEPAEHFRWIMPGFFNINLSTYPEAIGGAALNNSGQTRAILQALLVTILWSTSWVLIKFTIDDIPPLTFAALRYTVAFLALLPGLRRHKVRLRSIRIRPLSRMFLLGLVFYTLTQGGQFLTLKYLEATTFSLMLNFTTILVAIIGIRFLGEKPNGLQWLGIVVFLGGVAVYFSSTPLVTSSPLGVLFAVLTVFANAIASVLGRSINRDKSFPPYVVTVVSMGFGALGLMGIAQMVDGLPSLNLVNAGVILWLAVINTAFAFTLWNKTLQVLTAAESSLINNTMIIQIALLSWLFLGEELTRLDIIGLLVAFTGLILANIKNLQNKDKNLEKQPG